MEDYFRKHAVKAGYTDEIMFNSSLYTGPCWDKAYEQNAQEYGSRLDCRISFASDGQALMLMRPEGKKQATALVQTADSLTAEKTA